MNIELPAMVGTFKIFSVKVSAVQWHTPVGAGVAQGEGAASAVPSDNQWNLKQHRLVELIAMNAIGGQGAIPEPCEHERVRRLALGRVEFGHGEELLILDC